MLQLVIHIILFSSLITTRAESELVPMAKGKCQPTCGNVSIPFPFGIGKGCYLNEWFEVVCIRGRNNSSTSGPQHFPVLKRINLEVIRFHVEGTVDVNHPITFWNCRSRKTHEQQNGTNLEGSPFVFSEKNLFSAVGCGALAMMKISSESYFGGQRVVGCSSSCGGNNVKVGKAFSCNGTSCCTVSIPLNTQTFKLELHEIVGKACRYAFVSNRWWVPENIYAMHDMTVVPVVLDWGLDADKIVLLGKSWPLYQKNLHEKESSCKRISDDAFSLIFNQSIRFECHCNHGFQGNPYIRKGCQDIDECALVDKPCEDDYHCINTYGSYSCKPKKKKALLNKMVFIGIGSGFGVLLIGSWRLCKFVKKRRNVQDKKRFFKHLLQQQLSSGEANVEKTKLFNSKELEKATDGFNIDRVLGQGGQGTVYKGMLTDGTIVAIKKYRIMDESKVKEFINEVVILSQINHRNVVKLLGCCLETEVPLLVYEYVPNGALSQHIYDEQDEFLLTWEMRLRIAIEIAGALSYLHSSASLPIFHRDIKSTNILLDGKYRAKIADFGISRSVAVDQTHLSTQVLGTFGYLDPEYFQSSQLTDKSDVYSFGVVLVELLTGQKPVSTKRLEDGRGLVTYFLQSIEDNNLFDIVDARVMKEAKRDSILAYAELAKGCLNSNGKKRPTMKEVATVLEDIQRSEKASCSYEQNFEEVGEVREVPDKPLGFI